MLGVAGQEPHDVHVHAREEVRSDIKRLYSYNWQGTDCQNRFDAGLVHPDGTARPAYDAFKAGAKSFAR